MRLFDELEDTTADFEGAPVVEISDVARMIYVETDQEHWPFPEAFPKPLCPWERAFFEYNLPHIVHSEGQVMRFPKGVRVGLGVQLHPAQGSEMMRNLARAFAKGQGEDGPALAAMYANPPETAHTVQLGTLYLKPPGQPVSWHEPRMHLAMLLDKQGDFVPDSLARFLTGLVEPDEVLSSNGLFFSPFMAMSLLNCKNVSTQTHEVPEKVAKARIKKGKPPGTAFRTLVVKVPGTKEPARLSLPDPERKANARHIVRGHFATYTAEKPLFGRVTGTFYHPMHVRGRSKERTVTKDYRLKIDEAA